MSSLKLRNLSSFFLYSLWVHYQKVSYCSSPYIDQVSWNAVQMLRDWGSFTDEMGLVDQRMITKHHSMGFSPYFLIVSLYFRGRYFKVTNEVRCCVLCLNVSVVEVLQQSFGRLATHRTPQEAVITLQTSSAD